VKLANSRFGVRRNLAVGIEAESERIGTEFDARGLGLITGALTHQQPPANATDEDRELVISLARVKTDTCLTRGVCGSLRQTIEIPVHQLRGPSLGNVAGKRHRPRLMIDRENRAHYRRVGMIGIVNLDRKQQR
jgi:hypothetical protein